jgi:hypothetical protein
MSTAQIPLEGMPAALFTCSPSKLVTWLDCPRRYRLQYVERRPSGMAWAHNSMGSSAHLALRDWFDLDIEDRTPDAGAALVHRLWVQDGYRDDAQSATWRARVSEMVHRYLQGIDPESEPIARERSVAFTTARLSVSGKVDRVDVVSSDDSTDSGALEHVVVVDYKTTKQALTDDDARSSLALALYVLGVRRTLRRPCTRVELHHLPTGNVLVHEHTDESLARHLARAESIAAEALEAQARIAPQLQAVKDGEVDAVIAADEAFPTKTGPMCGWCDMRRWCPQGQEAAPQRQPWDGLADLDIATVPAQGD